MFLRGKSLTARAMEESIGWEKEGVTLWDEFESHVSACTPATTPKSGGSFPATGLRVNHYPGMWVRTSLPLSKAEHWMYFDS